VDRDDAGAVHIVVYTFTEAEILRIREEGHQGGAQDMLTVAQLCGTIRAAWIEGSAKAVYWMAPATKAVRPLVRPDLEKVGRLPVRGFYRNETFLNYLRVSLSCWQTPARYHPETSTYSSSRT
jgi:hypothetical protein